jgi:hypothetical protein
MFLNIDSEEREQNVSEIVENHPGRHLCGNGGQAGSLASSVTME